MIDKQIGAQMKFLFSYIVNSWDASFTMGGKQNRIKLPNYTDSRKKNWSIQADPYSVIPTNIFILIIIY